MENNNRTRFSSKKPHFFKIILEETLQEDKLRIPYKFLRNYGETLSNTVSVTLPCGTEWKMRLLKQDNGKVWLKMGWPEFVKHYSLRKGNFLIFRYMGNSKFHAVICDTTTVEIDYPHVPAHVNKSVVDSKPRVPRGEVFEDDFVEILDESSPRCKRAEKPPLSCSPRHMRMRTSPTSKTESDSAHPKPEGSKTVTDKPTSKGGTKNRRLEMKGKQDLPAENDSAKPMVTRQGGSETIRHMKPLEASETNAAVQKARGFKSKHPFVKVLLQSSSTTLTFPSEFAMKYLKYKSNAIFKVSDGRTWSAKYVFKEHYGSPIARFTSGWKEFAQDNNLEDGDVCVFVLLNRITILFEVIIFHVSRNSKVPIFPAPRGKATRAEREESLTDETESCGLPRSHGKLPEQQASVSKSTTFKTRMNSKPEATGKQHHLKGTDRAGFLERISFESQYPFFNIVMQPSYIGGRSCFMPVPHDFARTYIKNDEGDVHLLGPKARFWSAQLRMISRKTGDFTPRISAGWKAFAADNNLQVGDVCIFELVNGTEITFQVSIFRAADYARNHRHSQADDASTSGGKRKRDARGKT